MNEYFDALETRPPEVREAQLMQALSRQVTHAKRNTWAYAEIFREVDPDTVCTREALARLPVTRKHDLVALQRQSREARSDPFGGFSSARFGPAMSRVFASPGPLYEPEGHLKDYWRVARAMHAAGFRRGDLIHNAFSYHFTPAGAIIESSALTLGCTVLPAGTGQTELQVRTMVDLGPSVYAGTPSFLKIILERAADMGEALPTLNRALFSGEACPESLREWFKDRGIQVYQVYATADLGLLAYETSALEGMVLDENLILEIVQPGTGEPVSVGEVGEVVVTTLNPTYPLVRFATGDLSAFLPGQCPTGRTNMRIEGWLGRADQTTKVRGMFVHPAQVKAISERFTEICGARLVVSGEMASDRMVFQAEVTHPSEGLEQRIQDAVRDVTKLRTEVALFAPGALPKDGKTIEDLRSYR
ncbi:MAG: AMP-binding protein [Pseudomonadota bacterium]